MERLHMLAPNVLIKSTALQTLGVSMLSMAYQLQISKGGSVNWQIAGRSHHTRVWVSEPDSAAYVGVRGTNGPLAPKEEMHRKSHGSPGDVRSVVWKATAVPRAQGLKWCSKSMGVVENWSLKFRFVICTKMSSKDFLVCFYEHCSILVPLFHEDYDVCCNKKWSVLIWCSSTLFRVFSSVRIRWLMVSCNMMFV